MHLLSIHRNLAKDRFRRHAKVALRVVRRHVPLIAEEKLDLAPRNFRLQQRIASEQSVQYFRRGTAGERDGEGALLLDGLARCVQKFRRGRLRDALGILQDSDFLIVRHSLVCTGSRPPNAARKVRWLVGGGCFSVPSPLTTDSL